MSDKFPFFAAESGTWRTTSPNPHVDLSGTALTLGTYPVQTFAAAAADTTLAFDSGQTCTVTIWKDATNFKRYEGAVWTDAATDTLDLSAATLMGVAGSIANGDAVSVVASMPVVTPVAIGAEPSLGNPGTTGYVLSSTTAGARSWVAQSGAAWDGDIADIDLDGGTDIGAALADADLILVDDGASGTNRKATIDRLLVYAQPNLIRDCGVKYASATTLTVTAGRIAINGAVYTAPSDTTLTSGSTMLNLAGNTVTLGASKAYWVFAYNNSGTLAFRVEEIDSTGDGADVVWDVALQYHKAATTGANARRIGKIWTKSDNAIAVFFAARMGNYEQVAIEATATFLLLNGGTQTSYTAISHAPYIMPSDRQISLGPTITRSTGTNGVTAYISLDGGSTYHGSIALLDGVSSSIQVMLRPVWLPSAGTLHYYVAGSGASLNIILLGFGLAI